MPGQTELGVLDQRGQRCPRPLMGTITPRRLHRIASQIHNNGALSVQNHPVSDVSFRPPSSDSSNGDAADCVVLDVMGVLGEMTATSATSVL